MAERPDLLAGRTNMELIRRYRFDRDGILYLEQLIGAELQPRTARHRSLSAEEKLLIALRFFATGEIQLNDGDLHHVSQSTVSKVVTEVTESLITPGNIQNFVKFPSTIIELDNQVQQFLGIAGFPKVVGVIDGTHIRILAPTVDEDIYVNRKGHHSINVQIVFDAFDNIIDVVSRWPGSTHDSRILHNSGLRQMFERGLVPAGYHLLGDSGYPSRSWLLTPYLNPLQGAQTAYNRSHKITRAKVERGIGQLKRRFGLLHGEIRTKPEKACRIVMACVILHNICKQRAIPLPAEVNLDDNNNQPDDDNQHGQAGLRYRDHFANTYFS